MGQIGTGAAARKPGRDTAWVKAAVAATAIALSSGITAWVADFNPLSALQQPAFANVTASLSFDDRFGSRSTLNTNQIYYPSRSASRSKRADFNTEFGEIEAMLAPQPDDDDADQPDPPTPVAATPAIPLPRSRPAQASVQLASLPPRSEPQPQGDDRTILQKIADLMPLRLASLEPNGGILSGSGPNLTTLGYDRTSAVYDISARVVYLPSGVKLEAHSGLGRVMDDTAHVTERNVGPTPPGVYDLTPREKLFHGVQALRMNPVDGTNTFGRAGLLTHSFMLGPNGNSNGCVSIKNYDRFLKAYQDGEIRRLVVVPSLSDRTSASRAMSQS